MTILPNQGLPCPSTYRPSRSPDTLRPSAPKELGGLQHYAGSVHLGAQLLELWKQKTKSKQQFFHLQLTFAMKTFFVDTGQKGLSAARQQKHSTSCKLTLSALRKTHSLVTQSFKTTNISATESISSTQLLYIPIAALQRIAKPQPHDDVQLMSTEKQLFLPSRMLR